MRRMIRLTLGLTLMFLGLLGLALPFLQGFLFLALGALLLAEDIPHFQRLVDKLEDRMPHIKKFTTPVRNFLRGPGEPPSPA